MNGQKEERLLNHIVQMMKQKALHEYKHKPLKRSAHAKTLAILKGYLKVESHLPYALKTEFFKEGAIYPAIIRISNSSSKEKKDSKKDIRGFAIKVWVKGETQDFILVSTKHMPIRNIEGFEAALCVLNKIKPIGSGIRLIRNTRISELLKLALNMKHETSPLDITYYSITPYAYKNTVVKYCVVPTSRYHSKRPFYLTDTYLRDNMKKHLKSHCATFDFKVQLQKEGMSIEDASQNWSEVASPFIKVGEVRIGPQIFDTSKRRRMGEKLSFSPGHALRAHRPKGGLNRARVKIYQEMARFRIEK